MSSVIDLRNNFFRSDVLICGLLAAGLFFTLRLACLAMVRWGLMIAWNASDASRGLMAFVDLMGILALSGSSRR